MLLAAVGFSPATAGARLQEFVDLATILNALRALGGRRNAAVQAQVAAREPAKADAPTR